MCRSKLEEMLSQALGRPVTLHIEGNIVYPPSEGVLSLSLATINSVLMILMMGIFLVPSLLFEEKEDQDDAGPAGFPGQHRPGGDRESPGRIVLHPGDRGDDICHFLGGCDPLGHGDAVCDRRRVLLGGGGTDTGQFLREAAGYRRMDDCPPAALVGAILVKMLGMETARRLWKAFSPGCRPWPWPRSAVYAFSETVSILPGIDQSGDRPVRFAAALCPRHLESTAIGPLGNQAGMRFTPEMK